MAYSDVIKVLRTKLTKEIGEYEYHRTENSLMEVESPKYELNYVLVNYNALC